MSFQSSIEWTQATWNPVTGCTKISPGCKNCYAKTFSERFRGVPGHPFEQGFDLRLWPERLHLPLSWKKPRVIFVNSMSDLFHNGVPEKFIFDVFSTMTQARWHNFQLLTKRAERFSDWSTRAFANGKNWPRNVWAGVSVESQDYVWRVEHLLRVPAEIRFLSIEPLLGPVKLNKSILKRLDWVIVGGESGHYARAMSADWARAVRDQCIDAGVPFFFKQWGVHNSEGRRLTKRKAGRTLDGRTWSEMPASTALSA